jgi:hypothetical protein
VLERGGQGRVVELAARAAAQSGTSGPHACACVGSEPGSRGPGGRVNNGALLEPRRHHDGGHAHTEAERKSTCPRQRCPPRQLSQPHRSKPKSCFVALRPSGLGTPSSGVAWWSWKPPVPRRAAHRRAHADSARARARTVLVIRDDEQRVVPLTAASANHARQVLRDGACHLRRGADGLIDGLKELFAGLHVVRRVLTAP